MKMKTIFLQHDFRCRGDAHGNKGASRGNHKYFLKISHIYHVASTAVVTPRATTNKVDLPLVLKFRHMKYNCHDPVSRNMFMNVNYSIKIVKKVMTSNDIFNSY